MSYIDYLSFHPKEELKTAFSRSLSPHYYHCLSLKGRGVCLLKVGHHATLIFAKPIFYLLSSGMGYLALKYLGTYRNEPELERDFILKFKKIALCGFVAPFSEMALTAKAALGILFPGFYFKKNFFEAYFIQLAKIAEDVKCSEKLVNCLKNGSKITLNNLNECSSRSYYMALFQQKLEFICRKFAQPDFPNEQKFRLLKMLEPDEDIHSGIEACPPGFGRLLNQICAAIDIPSDHEKVFTWLTTQLKEEIINQMILHSENSHSGSPDWHFALKKLSPDSMHRANALILLLGEKIHLPQLMRNEAKKDDGFLKAPAFEESLLKAFNSFYTKEAVLSYFKDRINSHPDGEAGLVDFRKHIERKLIENTTDEEIEMCKKAVQAKFQLSDLMADEPIYYVKYHFFLYPDVEPQDPKSTDLNDQGIIAFAKTLNENPFNYFS